MVRIDAQIHGVALAISNGVEPPGPITGEQAVGERAA